MKKGSHVKGIPYVRIGVSDMKNSVSFYQDILGLEKISEWPTGAIFDVGGVELGLELKAKPEICLLVDDVDKAYRNLKDEGVKFVTEPKDQVWGGRTAGFVDPDGNAFEIESFQCKICGKICQSYRELLEEHLKKHK
jgi:catechol 2,3-dioxygenase-like lactoylglutathione lyase family enzyme